MLQDSFPDGAWIKEDLTEFKKWHKVDMNIYDYNDSVRFVEYLDEMRYVVGRFEFDDWGFKTLRSIEGFTDVSLALEYVKELIEKS